MRSGADTLGGLEDALRDLKAQEARLQNELEGADKQRAQLLADRLDALKTFAAARLRDAMADGVINEADNIADQIRGALEARLKSMQQLAERHATGERQREAIVGREDVARRKIETLDGQLDRFAAAAREALANVPEHQQAVLAYQSQSEMLANAAKKAEQAARDENEKGLPYRSDPLFMYLWERKYGSQAYTASGLVRVLDQWVAGLIRYHDARANYAMLTEIPVRLRSHAETLRQQVEAAKAQVDALEANKTRELAGGDIIGALKVEREQQAQLNKELESVTAELAETTEQLRLYAKGEDSSLKSTVAAYAKLLEREPLRSLLADAARTPNRDDDRAVGRVQSIGDELQSLDQSNAVRRRKLDQIADRKLELARLASNFRRQKYDDAASEFEDNPGVEDLLQLLLRGAITAADYWARMQSQQHWRHRPADPWRREAGLPPFGGFPGGWGGGSSGGGWSSGGGNGGGSGGGGGGGRDFETGGMFVAPSRLSGGSRPGGAGVICGAFPRTAGSAGWEPRTSYSRRLPTHCSEPAGAADAGFRGALPTPPPGAGRQPRTSYSRRLPDSPPGRRPGAAGREASAGLAAPRGIAYGPATFGKFRQVGFHGDAAGRDHA
ncbi:MAG: hypothetical protein R3D67_21825 [Hyphomicrobiaceae bacterium]